MIIMFIFLGYCSFAQPPAPNGGSNPGSGNTPVGGGAPIDGGLTILLTLSAIYGATKIKKFKKED